MTTVSLSDQWVNAPDRWLQDKRRDGRRSQTRSPEWCAVLYPSLSFPWQPFRLSPPQQPIRWYSLASCLHPHASSHLWSVKKIKHDDVIKLKPFLRYWPFVRGIHRSLVNSPRKGQWRGALMFSLICAWINGLVNNREAGDLRRHRAHYDVTVMKNRYENQNRKTMTSWRGNAFSIAGPPYWKSTKDQYCRLLFFPFCKHEHVLERTFGLPVIWDAMVLKWRHWHTDAVDPV